MLTTLIYSLLALDQTIAHARDAVRAVALCGCCSSIIFAETGLVVFPFLPGDSILFIAGTVVATAGLNVHLLVVVLAARGDPRRLGQLLDRPLHRAHGSSSGPIRAGSGRSTCGARRRSTTGTAASRSSSAASCRSSARSRRFSPASPAWRYRRFLSLQRRSAASPGSRSLVYAGYLFGNIPWVKHNLSLIVVGIVVVSLMPAVVTFLRERRRTPR